MNVCAEAITPAIEEFKAMAHKHLDQALEKLRPLFEQDTKPTLQEISDAMQDFKQDLAGSLVQEAAQTLHQNHGQPDICQCPQCGTMVKKLRDASRQIQTRHGSSLITRPYFYCRRYGHGFCPLDEDLGLSTSHKQHDLQQLALKFLSKMPFEEAAELFQESTGTKFSDHCMHKLFASFAEDLAPEEVIPSAEDIASRIEQATSPGSRRPMLIVATDGAHMPTRPGPGRNTKRGSGE